MRKYELTYLISDEVQEGDLNKVTGKISGLIADLKGKVEKEDIWGRRKLVYPIKKQDFATYITLYFYLPADKVNEFEKDLRHADNILRHLLIVKDYGTKEITLSAEDIAEAEDIESAIGGEKSFEMIEGETEESRDLMAKREQIAEEEAPKEEPQKEASKVSKKDEVQKNEIETEKKTEEKPAKKVAKKASAKKAEELEKEAKEEKPASKTKKSPAKPKKEEKKSDEAERLSKLNEELDDILKDEL